MGWGKHCHLFSYKAVKERLPGKNCLCTHFILGVIYGRETSWQSSWLELGIKKKGFLSSSQVPCMPPSKPKVAGRCSPPHALDVANTSHRGSVPHGRGLADVAPVFSKCYAVCMLSRTKLGPCTSLGPIRPKSNSLAATALITREGPWAPATA